MTPRLRLKMTRMQLSGLDISMSNLGSLGLWSLDYIGFLVFVVRMLGMKQN